jgi:hypothetical protein
MQPSGLWTSTGNQMEYDHESMTSLVYSRYKLTKLVQKYNASPGPEGFIGSDQTAPRQAMMVPIMSV